jgi:hypothetical protein
MRTWSSSFGARPSFAMCCVPVRIVGFNVAPDLSGGGSCRVKGEISGSSSIVRRFAPLTSASSLKMNLQ